jgi:hypothetical protein
MKKAIPLFFGIATLVIGLMGSVARSNAAPYPTGIGGTGTAATPSAGQVLIGTGGGIYTPAYLLCAGTCSISSASGTITITGTGVATNTGNWAGTWQLYNPSDFLSSSTPVVNTVNGGSGTVTITSSTLGVVWPTINGTKSAAYNITATNGATSTVSGATTTISVSLNNGSAVTCSANQFLNTISATGTAQCGTISFPTNPTYTVAGGTGVSTSIATSSTNTTTTVTLNINNGSVQTCTTGQDANSITGTGIISCIVAVHTLDGVTTSTISFIAAGGTSISTTTNSITFTSVSTSTANTWTALQTFTGLTANGQVTLASTTNALLTVNGSGQVSGYAGSTCSAGQAPQGISATGTVQTCTAYLTGNQSVTLTISGDATGTASGATSINDSIQVTGLLGKSLPSLATGTLEYTGGAWTLAPIATSATYTFAAGAGESVSQTTSTTNTTTTYTNTGVTSLNGATGTATYADSCVSGCTVTTSTTGSAITVTASSNNATGTPDATAVYNATNTLISTQPFIITPTLLASGCVGSSTASTLNGCVQAIILNQISVASGTSIIFSGFFGTSTYPAAINLNTNGFAVQISCTAGTVLEYGGTQANASSGAQVFNFGDPAGHPILAEFAGCDTWGHTSKLIAGNTNTATTTGIYFGGSYGAVGINYMGNINGFGINYVVGQNAYMDAFTGTSSGGNGGVITQTGNVINGSSMISGVTNGSLIPLGAYVSGTGIPNNSEVIGTTSSTITMNQNANATGTSATLTVQFGSLGQYDLANNSGERPIVSGVFTDPGNSSATNAIYIAGGGVADWFCVSLALDDAQLHAGYSNGLIGCAQVHIEDSDYSNYGAYTPIWLDSSQATFADFESISVANDPSAANTSEGFQTIIKHGVNLKVGGLFIQNYNGATVVNAVDHSLNNGSESEQICDVQTTNGTGLTNIVAGGGGNTYSQAAGLGCSQDVANSYTINIFPNGNNTNDITSGNAIVATFDHTGDWTFQNNGTNGSVTITGTLSASGNTTLGGTLNASSTITQAGVPVLTTAVTNFNGSASSTQNYANVGSGNVTTTKATSGGNSTTTISLTGQIPAANIDANITSSTWSLIIDNATTTASTTNYASLRTAASTKLAWMGCYDTVGTTTLNIFIPTAFSTTTVSSTVNGSFACGGGNSSTLSTVLPAGSYLDVEVSSTAGTPVATFLYIDSTTQ